MLGKARIESAPDGRRPISLDVKRAGEPSAGNRHARFEVAGAGNQLTVWLVRHSQRKRGANKLGRTYGATAPVLDLTLGAPPQAAVPDLADLPRQPCEIHGVRRLFYRADHPVPGAVCVSGAGA